MINSHSWSKQTVLSRLAAVEQRAADRAKRLTIEPDPLSKALYEIGYGSRAWIENTMREVRAT